MEQRRCDGRPHRQGGDDPGASDQKAPVQPRPVLRRNARRRRLDRRQRRRGRIPEKMGAGDGRARGRPLVHAAGAARHAPRGRRRRRWLRRAPVRLPILPSGRPTVHGRTRRPRARLRGRPGPRQRTARRRDRRPPRHQRRGDARSRPSPPRDLEAVPGGARRVPARRTRRARRRTGDRMRQSIQGPVRTRTGPRIRLAPRRRELAGHRHRRRRGRRRRGHRCPRHDSGARRALRNPDSAPSLHRRGRRRAARDLVRRYYRPPQNSQHGSPSCWHHRTSNRRRARLKPVRRRRPDQRTRLHHPRGVNSAADGNTSVFRKEPPCGGCRDVRDRAPSADAFPAQHLPQTGLPPLPGRGNPERAEAERLGRAAADGRRKKHHLPAVGAAAARRNAGRRPDQRPHRRPARRSPRVRRGPGDRRDRGPQPSAAGTSPRPPRARSVPLRAPLSRTTAIAAVPGDAHVADGIVHREPCRDRRGPLRLRVGPRLPTVVPQPREDPPRHRQPQRRRGNPPPRTHRHRVPGGAPRHAERLGHRPAALGRADPARLVRPPRTQVRGPADVSDGGCEKRPTRDNQRAAAEAQRPRR